MILLTHLVSGRTLLPYNPLSWIEEQSQFHSEVFQVLSSKLLFAVLLWRSMLRICMEAKQKKIWFMCSGSSKFILHQIQLVPVLQNLCVFVFMVWWVFYWTTLTYHVLLKTYKTNMCVCVQTRGFHNVVFTVWCLTCMKGGMCEMTEEEMEGREQRVQRDTREQESKRKKWF